MPPVGDNNVTAPPGGSGKKLDEDEDEDFSTRQERLQNEARMALAQVYS